jgi:soluble lytic murein transglycosylase-like protein
VGKVAALMMILLSSSLHGERLYSYVDDSGSTVLTNLGSDRGSRGTPLPATTAEPDGNYSALIRQYGTQYGVDTDLISAIIKVESGFDSRAVSTKDCKGLMQLHPDTAKRFGVNDVFDPAENIEGGVKYLTFLMDSFDRKLDLVLAAYNAGENAVRRYQGIPPYRETIEYVDKVKTAFGKDLESLKPERRVQRVVRIVDESGAIVLTNAPVQEVGAGQTALLTR